MESSNTTCPTLLVDTLFFGQSILLQERVEAYSNRKDAVNFLKEHVQIKVSTGFVRWPRGVIYYTAE